jgi:hypothetical protein
MNKTISEDIHAAVNQVFDELQAMAAHMGQGSGVHVISISTQLNRIRYLADRVKEQ